MYHGMKDIETMRTNERFAVTIDGQRAELDADMLARHGKPGPRYTSYPTVPEWDPDFGPAEYEAALHDAAGSARPLSLYLHLPFCRSLCLFCGCNVVISRNQEISIPYLERLERELDMVAAIDGGRPVEQIHWGGGSPTFLTPEQIEHLARLTADRFTISSTAEISVELDPRTTTPEQCRAFRATGFNRVSMGVQDFDPRVQETVRRLQSYEMVAGIVEDCRGLGFQSINIDLIYGLPHQTPASFAATIDRVVELAPERIALFSYAHVPWLKKQQGSFARHLPDPATKFRIFATAIEKLTDAGYLYIGLDHFVRPDDELSRAQRARTLHRNFQGYTTKAGCDLIGMGASSISMLDRVYAQNHRDLHGYYEKIDAGRFATLRGIRLSDEDLLRRAVIGEILCNGVVVKREIDERNGIDFDRHFAEELDGLRELERDGLVALEEDRFVVTPIGRIFLRVVAMTFDAYLRKPREEPLLKVFSNTL